MNYIWELDYTGLSPSGAVELDMGDCCDAVVNLTPHPLNIDFSSFRLHVPVHGKPPARVEAKEAPEQRVRLCLWVPDCLVGHHAPAYEYSSAVIGLPPAPPDGEFYRSVMFRAGQSPRIWFVVSLLTALALRGTRHDILVPGEEVRDYDGRIIGCKGLRRVV